MNEFFSRSHLGDGVFFSSVRDTKFKHNAITVNLIVPLDEEKAAERAVVPFLLRKGSKCCPDFTVLEQMLCRLYGADLDANVGQYGEFQILSCSITCVDDRFALEGEAVGSTCAKLLGEIVLDPNITEDGFPEEDFLLERQYLIDTIEAEINEKRTYAVNQCRREMSRGTCLAVSKYGTVETTRALTARGAAAQYKELLETARIEIIFVGCGDAGPVEEVFARLFAGKARRPAAHTPAPIVQQGGELRQKVEHLDVIQSKLVMGLRTGPLEDKHQIDAARLMTYLYGGAPFSLLFQNVREKLSLCYYCAARFDPATGILMVDMGLEQAKRKESEIAILDQLGAISRGEFPEKDAEAAKLAYANSLRSVGDSLTSVESWCMTRIMQGTNYSPDDEVRDIMAITPRDIADAAKRVTLDTVYFLTGKEQKTDA